MVSRASIWIKVYQVRFRTRIKPSWCSLSTNYSLCLLFISLTMKFRYSTWSKRNPGLEYPFSTVQNRRGIPLAELYAWNGSKFLNTANGSGFQTGHCWLSPLPVWASPGRFSRSIYTLDNTITAIWNSSTLGGSVWCSRLKWQCYVQISHWNGNENIKKSVQELTQL